MATQLFLLDGVSDTHLGTDNTNLLGTAVGWTSKALGTARGSGVVASDNVATVTGATAGVTITKTSPVEWISPPVAADVTISGTITLNIWSSETNMSANVAINARIFVIRANATATRNSNTLDTIATTARVTEVAVTTRAADNFTVTPTSTTLNRGDRIRVIVFGDDVGTMAATYTFNISWGGTSAAADGDSYVTFTENITFESAPGVFGEDTSVANTSSLAVGRAPANNEAQAQSFTAAGTITEVRARLWKTTAPTDDLELTIETDSASKPSGTVVATVGSVAAGTLTTTNAEYTFSSLSISLTPGTTYWLVFRRTGALNSTDYFNVGQYGKSGARSGSLTSGVWTTFTSIVMDARIYFGVSTVYLTDTASAVSTASVDREAWTSRGSGVVTSVTPTAAGWTAPIQAVYTLARVSHFPTATSFLLVNGASGASSEMLAQSILSSATAGTLAEVQLTLYKNNAPADNLVIELQSDSGGVPSGSAVGTIATVSAATYTTTPTVYTYSCSISVAASTQYWIVLRRSGARDTTNNVAWQLTNPGTYADGGFFQSISGVWGVVSGGGRDGLFGFTVNDTVIDWFTRPLTAFTLTGMAVANIRALESNAAANASLRCEIARVEGDGTSPTVWCSWACAPTGTDNGELTTSEVARTINLSGDDLAITNGQRLRIRLYNEDSSAAAMVTGHTVTRYYAGTSAAASGDTYITFPQTLTEYSSGPYTYTKAGYGRESA